MHISTTLFGNLFKSKGLILFFVLSNAHWLSAQSINYGNYNGYSHRLTTPSGYIDIGPKNPDWAHIYTDRSRFIFNRPVFSVNGAFSAYDQSDLHLQTNGTTRLSIAKANGHVTIKKYLLVEGADFRLGLNSGRDKGVKTNQRALVHNTSDRLFINYLGDFEGGVVVQGPKTTFTGAVDVEGGQNRVRLWKGTGTSPLVMYSDGDGTNNNASVNIYSYGYGGSQDLNFRIQNWSGSYLFKYHASGGIYNVAQIRNGGGGSNGPNSGYGIFDLYEKNQGTGIRFSAEGTSYIKNGSVGIGTTTPRQKLDVNGTIRSKEVLVEASPWPDYVFKEEYQLQSLLEVEQFIKEHGHLPNIPIAQEVEENGIALGDINTKLLEKIEELTLHSIDQEKKIQALEEKLNLLINELKND